MERRKYETEEEKLEKLPGIRDYSRQAYLKKREEQKLEELRDAIEDEKALFAASFHLSHLISAPLSVSMPPIELMKQQILSGMPELEA